MFSIQPNIDKITANAMTHVPGSNMYKQIISNASLMTLVGTFACAPDPGLVSSDSEMAGDSRPQIPGHMATSDDTTGMSSESSGEPTTGESDVGTSTGGTTTDPETGSTDVDSDSETDETSETDGETGATSEPDSETTAETDSESEGDTDEPPFDNCWPDPEADPDPFVDCVEAFVPAPEVSFGHDMMPEIVLGGPEGKGSQAGGTDIVALGCGGSIIAFFDNPGIADGPGPDFIVFENPFATGDTTFTEPAQVSVSDDLETWYTFACETDGSGTWPPTGCAGIEPVLADSMNGIDPTDPAQAGGDAFDLADVGLAHARYVRLVDVTQEFYGSSTWCAGAAGGFDLDAIAAVHP